MKRFFMDLIRSPIDLFKEISSPEALKLFKQIFSSKQVWKTIVLSCLIGLVPMLLYIYLLTNRYFELSMGLRIFVTLFIFALSALFAELYIRKSMKKIDFLNHSSDNESNCSSN